MLFVAAVLTASLPLVAVSAYQWGYRCGAAMPFETAVMAQRLAEDLVAAQLRHGSPEQIRDALSRRLLTLDAVEPLPAMAPLREGVQLQRFWTLLLLWQTELGLGQADPARAHLEQAERLCRGGLGKDCSEPALTRTATAARELLVFEKPNR